VCSAEGRNAVPLTPALWSQYSLCHYLTNVLYRQPYSGWLTVTSCSQLVDEEQQAGLWFTKPNKQRQHPGRVARNRSNRHSTTCKLLPTLASKSHLLLTQLHNYRPNVLTRLIDQAQPKSGYGYGTGLCCFSLDDCWFKSHFTLSVRSMWLIRHLLHIWNIVSKCDQICVQTPCKRKTRYSENPPVEGHVGWVIDSKDHVTTASSTTASEPAVAITATSLATGTRYVNDLPSLLLHVVQLHTVWDDYTARLCTPCVSPGCK